MSFRSTAQKALLGLSYHGRGALLWDLVHGRRVRLLCYHGIPARAADDGVTNRHGYNITAAEFEEHVRYLERRCRVLSLDDAIAGHGLSRTRINVVLTFDDGYENNYTQAFRILRRRGLPAVYAVATDFVQNRTPLWNDVVEYAVTRSRRAEVTLRWDDQEHTWALDELPGRVALYDWLLRTCTHMPQEAREDLIDEAVRALEVSDVPDGMLAVEDYRPLTPEQIAEMSASGLAEIASHSVHHRLLPHLAPEEREAELVASRKAVEALTGRPCTTFCVPGGVYDARVVEEAFAAGYTRVLTSDGGFGFPGRRLLGRLAILHRTPPPVFADMVHGPVGPLLQRLAAIRGA